MVTARTVLLTGVPRSGTSLACRLLDGADDTVALVEPLRLEEFESLDTADAALSYLDTRLESIRVDTLRKAVAPSTHVAGVLSDARVAERSTGDRLRAPQGVQGEIRINKPLSSDFCLVVKHNALFAALMTLLSQRYRCLALVRNPLPVLASWQTVDLPVNRGHVPAGEKYDVSLRERLAGDPDCLQRQLDILDWFFQCYQQALPSEDILRYEQVIDSNGEALFTALGLECPVLETLANRNDSSLYSGVDVDRLLAALHSRGGSWQSIYSKQDLARAAAALEAGR